MTLGERILDPLLLLEQPVEGFVDLALGHLAPSQPLPEARRRSLRIESPHRRQLRGRCDDPVDDERHHQVAIAPARRSAAPFAQQLRQAELLRCAEHGGDMAMRQRPADGQCLVGPGQGYTTAQQRAQPLHQLLRPIGQVGERALLDLAVRAVALPQQDGRVGLTIGNRLDVHDESNRNGIFVPIQKYHKCMATKTPIPANSAPISTTCRIRR